MQRRNSVKVGERYESNNHGWFTVESVISYNNITVKFERTGVVKTGVRSSAIFSGKVRDPSRPREEKLTATYPVGSVWDSVNWGKFEILEIPSASDVTIRWVDTGNIQSGVTTGAIRKGYVVDKAEYDRTYDYLKPKEGYHYVYVARLNGQVIYVGQGFGKRYLHCRSGCSHNIELNRLYFSGVEIEVSIHKDGLSKDQAVLMEKQLIELIKPYCNSRRYFVTF